MGQRQELGEPGLLGLAPLRDLDPVLRSPNRAQDRDDKDRFKRMERRGMRAAWVLDIGEIRPQGGKCMGGVHWSCLAERVGVGEKHSTIQDTPIGTIPVDAIALAAILSMVDNPEHTCWDV